MLARFLAFIILVGASRAANACSLASPAEPVDGFVLYGEVVAHVEAPFGKGSTHGIEIAPRIEFRLPARTPDDRYELYPLGLAGDCTSTATTADEIAERFAVGSIVGVIGVVPDRTPVPGDIDVDVRWSVLFALRPGCDPIELTRRRHDYTGYEVSCGNYRFEANKDIALLETASPAQRLEIFGRLAEYRGYVRFLDLLAKHAPDPETGQRFRGLRYGESTLSCLATEQELEPLEWQRRARWGEYCMQDDPYDSVPPDTWNLYDAIAHNRLAVVEQFLSQGGDANEPLRGTPLGWVYPLRVAIAARNEAIVLALLRGGADLERSGSQGWSVSSTGMASAWDFLLTQSPARLPSALATIGSACRNGFYDVVDVVMRHAVDREVAIPWPDEIVGNCLQTSPDIARLLLERGAPITRYTLSAAAQSGSIGMTRHVLAHGGDPFERYRGRLGSADADIDGFAAIDFVLRFYEYADEPARRRIHYVLHELAGGPPPRSGARVETLARNVDEDLDTYAAGADRLAFAARFGLFDAVEELLADHEFPTETLRAAMRAALEGRNPDVARLLLASGAPISGGTLHIAAQTGPAGFVKHLIALGADVDERVDGRVPLESWLASERHDDEVVQVLVAAGANACDVAAKFEPDFMTRGTVLRATADCPR